VSAVNAAATSCLILAAICAGIHWWSVATKRRPVLLITKPLTMILLIGLAATIDTTAAASRAWFIAALVLSLAGDVFLMLEPDQFVAGLAAFLGAHLAYIVGLVLAGLRPSRLSSRSRLRSDCFRRSGARSSREPVPPMSVW